MRLPLAALGAALLATPASAQPGPLLARGTLDRAPAAYLGCVVLPQDATAYCFAAVPEAGGVTVTAVVAPEAGAATVTTVAAGASALTTGTYGARRTVRLRATVPGLGDVDLTSYTETSLLRTVVNDLCTPGAVHVELVAADESLSYAAWTDGTVGGQPARNLHGCATALATGPASGAWRMAWGL